MQLRSPVASMLVVMFACGDDGGGTKQPDSGTSGTVPTITTAAILPAVVAGDSVIMPIQLEATGDAPITWSLDGDTLAAGMTLSSTGAIAGRPTEHGDFTLTVTASNQFGADMRDFMLRVDLPPNDAIALLANNQISHFGQLYPPGASPGMSLSSMAVGEVLVAIDRRLLNNQLYGLGYNATTKAVSLYAIQPEINHAFPIGAPQTFATDITGTTFGMDFNPVADRVRVVTSTGQNFRMNPNNGLIVDGTPITLAKDRDADLNGGATTASECAYTNNELLPAGITTLYTVSGGNLYLQNPPNNGTLGTAIAITGVQTIHGFDLDPSVDAPAANAAVTAGKGYVIATATGQTAQQAGLVDLVSGAFTSLGTFVMTNIRGFALVAPTPRPVVALSGTGGALLRFVATDPSTIGTVNITGLTAGESLVGIDFRPETGELMGLGVNPTADTGSLYVIDPLSGVATEVAASAVAFTTNGTSVVPLPDPATTPYSFNIDPRGDLVRVTAGSLNFQINPNTGAALDGGGAGTAGTNPDAPLTGGATALNGIAYTNGPQVPGNTGAPGTLYGLSAATNSLHHIALPVNGVVGAATGITANGAALDFTAAAFDIPYSTKTTAFGTPVTAGIGYGALTVGGQTQLYSIDLVTGVATPFGTIFDGANPVRGLAVGQ